MRKHRIVCFGDSITQAHGQAEADRWTAQLAFLLEAKFPGIYEVYNRGVGGNTTTMALDRISVDVLPLLPAFVLIEFGINDGYVLPWCKTPRLGLADFHMNLREIIRQVTAGKGTPLVIVNHPLAKGNNRLHLQGNGKSVEENTSPYSTSVNKIARSQQVGLIDLPELMRREKIKPESLLAEDRVHLSSAGNRIYGRLVFNKIQKFLPQ